MDLVIAAYQQLRCKSFFLFFNMFIYRINDFIHLHMLQYLLKIYLKMCGT